MTTPSKRDRENKKARKKREKDERRWERRNDGPGSVPVVRAEDLTGEPSLSVEEIMASMSGGGGARPAARGIPTKLFVGGLSHETDHKSLLSAFEEHAEIVEAVVVTDRDTGRSRGFGFVTLASHKDASRVVRALDGSDLDGRRIAVNVATDRR